MKYDIKISKWKTRLERMTMNHLNHHSSYVEKLETYSRCLVKQDRVRGKKVKH